MDEHLAPNSISTGDHGADMLHLLQGMRDPSKLRRASNGGADNGAELKGGMQQRKSDRRSSSPSAERLDDGIDIMSWGLTDMGLIDMDDATLDSATLEDAGDDEGSYDYYSDDDAMNGHATETDAHVHAESTLHSILREKLGGGLQGDLTAQVRGLTKGMQLQSRLADPRRGKKKVALEQARSRDRRLNARGIIQR
jgi:hypothetical protein